MSAVSADGRAAFADGLRAMACFLETLPVAPVPPAFDGTMVLHVFPAGDTDSERRAAVDSAAAALGATAAESPPGSGHYLFRIGFGPVTYCVVSIDTDPASAVLEAVA